MMPRQMVQWRIYVYANSLYSLPDPEVRDFRKWSPDTYRHGSYDVHRIMNWVNRDISVLLRVKSEVFAVFELILDMLPLMSMRSDQFKDALTKHLGLKTNHFIHELINFARSPYENMIAYECNVQYKARREDDYDGPSTSAEARRLGQFMSPGLHNFVEFSRRINPDDCGGFEADLLLEDEDAEELDDLILDRKDVSVIMLAMDGGVAPSRSFARYLATMPATVPASATAAVASATVPASATVATSASVPESQQQQQQSTLEEPELPGVPGVSAFSNYELQLAVERSMRGEGFALASDWLMRPPSGGRTAGLSNRQVARNVIASNLYRIAHGPGAGAIVPVGAAAGGAGGGSGTGPGTAEEGGAGRGATGATAGRAAQAGSSTAGAAVNMSTQNAMSAAVRNRVRSRLRPRTRR